MDTFVDTLQDATARDDTRHVASDYDVHSRRVPTPVRNNGEELETSRFAVDSASVCDSVRRLSPLDLTPLCGDQHSRVKPTR